MDDSTHPSAPDSPDDETETDDCAFHLDCSSLTSLKALDECSQGSRRPWQLDQTSPFAFASFMVISPRRMNSASIAF